MFGQETGKRLRVQGAPRPIVMYIMEEGREIATHGYRMDGRERVVGGTVLWWLAGRSWGRSPGSAWAP